MTSRQITQNIHIAIDRMNLNRKYEWNRNTHYHNTTHDMTKDNRNEIKDGEREKENRK